MLNKPLTPRVDQLAFSLDLFSHWTFKLVSYLRCYSGLMFDVLAEPGGLLCDAVGAEAVDLVLYGQSFCLLVFVS